MATLGLSKVFILDKYFTELQKFWETEKKLQDASSSNEAVHLQQRLKNLSTELVTLRNRLHVSQGQNAIAATPPTATPSITANDCDDIVQQPAQHKNVALGINLELKTNNPQQSRESDHQRGNKSCNGMQTSLNVITKTNDNANANNIPNSLIQKNLLHNTLYNEALAGGKNINHVKPLHDYISSANASANATATEVMQSMVTGASVANAAAATYHSIPSASTSTASNLVNSNTLTHTTTGNITSRNTSIPHPLPNQINSKADAHLPAIKMLSHGSNEYSTSMPCVEYSKNSYKRSDHALHEGRHYHNQFDQHQHHHHQQQQLPTLAFVSTQKHLENNYEINSMPAMQYAYDNNDNNGNDFNSGASKITSTSNHHLNNLTHQYVNQIRHLPEQHEHQMLDSYHNYTHMQQPSADLQDLTQLSGPLTEDAVMRSLHSRFNQNSYFTSVGPILLSLNPYLDVGNPLTLTSTRALPLAPQLRNIIQEAVRQQADTGYPQAIILSGTSGAGKTHCSMLLLRQLFEVAGGGPETDAFKHLAAAFTVLRSLGSAKTTTNSESSRIGQFIEVQVTEGALYRTKIHCYFLDQTRVIRQLPKEKNYHIFYQMLAGLSREERVKLNLEGYSPNNLSYLKHGDTNQIEEENAIRFQLWKSCLSVLGIPFLDVVRVLAAILLLGNIQFTDGQDMKTSIKDELELNAVASLLGLSPAALFRGLTIYTHNTKGGLIKSACDATKSNMTRDCLAKALYCRTVATIVRRANSLKRLGPILGTLSSDSNDSVHNHANSSSQQASVPSGNPGSKSMVALNNAVRHATDGFIGILDMFGFEQPSPNAQLEHLCINLCAETMQHFYNTHIFKSSVESCRDEGIICDAEVDYVDNVPCIDLISSLRTGLLSMLDAECSARGTPEDYVTKIRIQHRNSTRLEMSYNEHHDPCLFTIRHFAGCVEYNASNFLDTNRDVIPDDLVAVFHKHTCNFGFATHLFGSELKALYSLQTVPRGLSFRIAPTSHTDLLNGDEPVSTLTQDFHTRLDNLLRTLVHARPHFIRCIRSNSKELANVFERTAIVKQIRSLQVLETVNLMASGFPHRMRFKQFNARYRLIIPFHLIRQHDDKLEECCSSILQYAVENPPTIKSSSMILAWAPGKRHVFFSEGIRQHLEHLRTIIRNKSAMLIQATWRGWRWRKKYQIIKAGTVNSNRSCKNSKNNSYNNCPSNAKHRIIMLPPSVKISKNHNNIINNVVNNKEALVLNAAVSTSAIQGLSVKSVNANAINRPRPQPIAGTPPPDPIEKCDSKIIQQTCNLFGLDLERPPPMPPSRNYTIWNNMKLSFPQHRLMKVNFPEDIASNPQTLKEQLKKGETVTVVSTSSCRGYLVVEHKTHKFHVPYQFLELAGVITNTTNIMNANNNLINFNKTIVNINNSSNTYTSKNNNDITKSNINSNNGNNIRNSNNDNDNNNDSTNNNINEINNNSNTNNTNSSNNNHNTGNTNNSNNCNKISAMVRSNNT